MKDQIIRSYKRFKQKGYPNWYWAIDVHDVIFIGDYKVDCELRWVRDAKRALKILGMIPEIKVILYTSTRKDKTQAIIDKILAETGLTIHGVNENPDFMNDPSGLCEFDKKFCFDVLLDDKAGFDAANQWEEIIEVLIDLGLAMPKEVADQPAAQNKWVSLREKVMEFGGKQFKYIYSHEDRCAGKIVVILPYRKNKDGEREYLLTREHNSLFGYNYTAITGGVDAKTTEMKKIREQAILELQEETGIMSGLHFVKKFTSIKSSDNQYFLFSEEISNEMRISVTGDGSIEELLVVKKWMKLKDALKVLNDPIALACLITLENTELK